MSALSISQRAEDRPTGTESPDWLQRFAKRLSVLRVFNGFVHAILGGTETGCGLPNAVFIKKVLHHL